MICEQRLFQSISCIQRWTCNEKTKIENYAELCIWVNKRFNDGEFVHIHISAHNILCAQHLWQIASLAPLEREADVDEDHRVLSIHCCDSKCRVTFQQTRQRHGEMQFSTAWRWRSGSVGQAFVQMPNYTDDRHTLWIVEISCLVHNVAFHDLLCC